MKIEQYIEKTEKTRGNPRNKSGFLRVSKDHTKTGYRRGYSWVYVGQENSVKFTAKAPTIEKLEKKVRAKGYKWAITDVDKARKTLMEEMK